MKRCFFIGDRDTPESLLPALRQVVEQHITQYEVTEFVVGRYGNFDRLAAHTVAESKQTHPHLTLTLLLPYHPAQHTRPVPPHFDGTVYPFDGERIPYRLAIVCANRRMVEQCDYLIAHIGNSTGNSRNLVDYARKQEQRGLHITLL